MKKITVLLFFLFTIILVSKAQEKGAIFQFEKTTHDFGTIDEAKGNVSVEFVFTNTGDAPLVIQNVQPSCGCTTPGWSKEPILPGKTGYIRAEFNPTNRPGAFNKSLTITANTNPNVNRLFIKGVVNPRERTVADDFPTKMGGIRVKYRSFNFGKITTEKPVSRNFDVYNDSDNAITFLEKIEAPEYITIQFSPATLQPKERGVIIITFDPTRKKELGFISDATIIHTNEVQESAKDFRVVATLEEYFPPMTAEELAKAPKLTFDKTNEDLGSVKQGQSLTTEFLITNSGKSDLNIRQVKSNCACLVTSLEKTTLKPGESIPLKLTFDSTGRRGVQQKSVSIFSNDPSGPTQMITIKTNVETEGATN